ncbi:hypothetical protein ACFLVP_01285 [Chloroflexota bacterium]
MFARVTGFQIKEGEVEAAINAYRDNIIPSRHLRKGSQGGYLLIDHKTGKGIVISFYTGEEYHGIANNESQFEEKKKIFKSHFASPHVDIGLYEVCTEG